MVTAWSPESPTPASATTKESAVTVATKAEQFNTNVTTVWKRWWTSRKNPARDREDNGFPEVEDASPASGGGEGGAGEITHR